MSNNVPKSIETFFYNKLVSSELFGQPKDGLLDSLKERVLIGTDEQFDRAAEIIIRERKSGAFPSMPVCLEAIKRAEQFRAVTVQSRTSMASGITGKTYAELALKHVQTTRRSYKIERSAEDGPWAWWTAYYDAIGARWQARMMRDPGRDNWTVPEEIPQHFDPAYRPEMAAISRVLAEMKRDALPAKKEAA